MPPQLATVPTPTFSLAPGTLEFEIIGAAITLTMREEVTALQEEIRDNFL